MTRRPVRLAAFSFLLVLGVPSLLYAFQTRMIFPGAESQGTKAAEVDPPQGSELVRLSTAQGVRVTALFARALTADGRPLRPEEAARRPTLLYFYGNGSFLRSAVDFDLATFRRHGVNVLIPDYVGYGLSGGVPSERGCYETADAAYDHLRKRRDVNKGSVFVLGRSLGGAVAIDLAARRPVAGLVVLSTFTTMSDMVRKQVPVAGLSLLLRHRFDSLSKIGKVSCPILIGHGSADGLVPVAMSARLAAAAKAPVSTFTVVGANHNDLEEVGGEQVADELRKFIARLGKGPTNGSTDRRDGVPKDP